MINHDSPLLKATQVLFGLNALIWLALAVTSAVRLAGGQSAAMIIVALLMVGNAAALFLSAYLVGKRRPAFYLLALAVLLVNIVLTFTDQFGLLDLLTLLVDLVLLTLVLVLLRAAFRPPA